MIESRKRLDSPGGWYASVTRHCKLLFTSIDNGVIVRYSVICRDLDVEDSVPWPQGLTQPLVGPKCPERC